MHDNTQSKHMCVVLSHTMYIFYIYIYIYIHVHIQHILAVGVTIKATTWAMGTGRGGTGSSGGAYQEYDGKSGVLRRRYGNHKPQHEHAVRICVQAVRFDKKVV